MPDNQTRIAPVDIETLPEGLRAELEAQRTLYGAPLTPYLYRAARGMWSALQLHTSRVPAALRGLLNRRVASFNACEF